MEGKLFTTKEYINNLLFKRPLLWNPIYGLHPFLIHSDIMGNLEILLRNLKIKNEYEVYEHELQIGTKLYDMRIISLAPISEEQVNLLNRAIINSQFCFVWESNPTLFIDIGSFYIIKQFIIKHNLKEYIIGIKEQPGNTENSNNIKVVTFSRDVNVKFDIAEEFEKHLRSYEIYNHLRYYYITFAFEWPLLQRIRPIKLKEIFYSALYITLIHLGTLLYVNDLNIIDLISLRLALVHYSNSSCPLKYEINYMIKRELSKFIVNNHLDIHQYMIEKNCVPPEGVIIDYLVYEFQDYFETFYLDKFDFFDTVKLVNESDALNKIKQNYNVKYKVDGLSYDQMTLSLFLDLFKFRNIRWITLDTNRRWLNDVSDPNIQFFRSDYSVSVTLIGENTYNFVENFISSLKTVTAKLPISLRICGYQNDYSIFDNLFVPIISFHDITINNGMLEQLHKCNLEAQIWFNDCTFENTHHNWELLNKLTDTIGDIEIQEDESTWQSLFEFVLGEMLKLNSKEFRFGYIFHINYGGQSNLNMRDIIFKVVDEYASKLEVCDDSSNIVDLYNLKHGFKLDDKSDYDFYQ